MCDQAMKKFLFILAAVLQVAIAGAQQVDTTGFHSEKRDTLKAAAVTVRRDLVTADADKLTYNVQADPKAEGSNLIDILRAVPMLSINGDEEVLLNGSNDYKVLVNGRSAGMLARNFNQLIKTIPASSIKEIQVITNPPVKYDAEGIGGIINIVLARRLKSGYSGSLGANASTLGTVSGNGYLNAQLGKFTFSANASGMYFPNPTVHGVTEIENYTSEANHYHKLEFDNNNIYRIGSLSLEASYEPDSLNLITLSGWTNFQKILADYDIAETFWNSGHVKTVEMLEPTVRTNRYNTFSGELACQKTFRNDGGILTFSYSIDGNPNSTDNNIIVKPVLNYPDYHGIPSIRSTPSSRSDRSTTSLPCGRSTRLKPEANTRCAATWPIPRMSYGTTPRMNGTLTIPTSTTWTTSSTFLRPMPAMGTSSASSP